ncbi:MAG: YbjN domain-containing protein [Azospirillum sp.]|nr:YbjN domain-containing protein [Azospirillum sp.]
MNLAANIPAKANPIDEVESFLNAHAYATERRGQNEVVVEVQGKWNDMLVFFSFEENMHCLHISCLMNIENQLNEKSKIFELLALINDDLWVGHFSYWTEQKMPVFRHSLFYDEQNPLFDRQIAQIFDIAVKECERMYPIFNVVLTKGMDPELALYPIMMETVGQA